MPLDADWGGKMLQLITSRYNDWKWRKKIEKTLSLPPAGLTDDVQRQIFLYLKQNLKAYKSRRADPDSWIVGGFTTKEVIERAKFDPAVIGAGVAKEHVAMLGTDPGADVAEAWWDEMLVEWFDQPEADLTQTSPSETDQAPEPSRPEP